MITVTAAIIEKDGLVFAARRKPGRHLAGYWEFPGGKLEPEETEKECLARELLEEFDVLCIVGDFFAESIHEYMTGSGKKEDCFLPNKPANNSQGTKIIRLLSYRVRHQSGVFRCRDHDLIVWLPVDELQSLSALLLKTCHKKQ
jgi:8-oxo-dGTP pyrophosphatase MutT (NUDIX family)